MAKYKDKWKTTFPTSIGNQTRPEDGVDNTQEYNTDGLPQYMANDPVRYDLQNAVNSQLVSNDERLNEKIKRTSDDLAAHNKDPKAHATGIAGNAATASKLLTPRTISLTGKAAGSTTFDGSSNASINVTSVNADTASKLSTARKINITGNATGAANFDGSGDISINATVNNAAHAEKAKVLDGFNELDNGNWGLTLGKVISGFQEAGGGSIQWRANDGKLYQKVDGTYWQREGAYEVIDTSTVNNYAPTKTGAGASGSWNINSATATKLQTPRTISLTGNASGSATFDGSGNISINTTVSNSEAASVVQRVIQPRGLYTNNDYVFYGTLTIPQVGDFFKLEVLGGSGHNGNVEQSTEGTLYFRTGNGNPANYAAYSEYHRNGTNGLKFFVVKDSGTQYRIYSEKTNYAGFMQVLPYVNARSSFNLSLTTVSALPSGAVEVESRQLVYTDMVNNYAPAKTGSGASGTWPISISGTAARATADSNGDKIDDTYLKKATVIDVIYPVGSIYMSMVDTDPATLFGVGTWARISQGRMLLGADDSTYKAGATGGEATHTLTAAEMPVHSHGMDGNGNHRHYIANTDENSGGWLGSNGYMEHKETRNSYENFELYGTGRDASVGLTSNNGWHTHNIQNSGGGQAHNNMPPYLVCYIWQRTA